MQGGEQRVARYAGVDEDKGSALVAHKFGGFMENPLQLERIRRMGQFGQQFIIFTRAGAGAFPFQFDPRAGHVICHCFHTSANKAVLRDVLKRTVAHELGRNPYTRLE